MRPKILVLYYTQTGQLRSILDSIVSDIVSIADIDFVPIEPVTPFPFPWKTIQFFDAMPETVQHIPIAVKPLSKEVMEKSYDLVIFGYQPWFLNPSQPATGFMKGEFAKVFNNKPVVTVIGCRNMWLHAQEKVKEYLEAANARLVGNIVLNDTNGNLVSLLTVIRWSFKGQKEASGMLPAAGVQDADIQNSKRFGGTILKHLQANNLIDLQRDLLAQGAIDLNPGLVILERRGIKNFRKWAAFIREKGGPGDPNRVGRVLLFKRLLIVAVFILSPISSFTASIQLMIKRSSLLKDVDYFKQLKFEKGKL
jgi:hypothetical protein